MDLSSLDKLKERMEEMAKLRLGIGVPSSGNASVDGGINMAGLAAIHEFGAPEVGIPERSFIRSTLKENNYYEDKLAIATKKVIKGEISPEIALDMVGIQATNDIKAKITSGINPPLKEATIKRKKSSKPLIDTGALIGSINYEVKP